jgi:hypothetical protein
VLGSFLFSCFLSLGLLGYLVSFESISIAEIEYCILKASMMKSTSFTGLVIASPPQTIFPGLAIQHRDFRFHYAINNGSSSLLETVPVFTPSNLDDQLDEITKQSIDQLFEIDLSRRAVTLPKLPFQDYTLLTSNIPHHSHLPHIFSSHSIHQQQQQHHSTAGTPIPGSTPIAPLNTSPPPAIHLSVSNATFPSSVSTPVSISSLPTSSLPPPLILASSSNASSASNTSYSYLNVVDCLRTILPYLSKPKQHALLQLLVHDPQHINVKYKPMSFKCRTLKKG